ncbi:MAG: hypothetical protein RL468_2323, partial [Pseudomonadota bacterium]
MWSPLPPLEPRAAGRYLPQRSRSFLQLAH